ncbi:MAG: serine hydrolase domain-containing protein [Actinomycetota bacterium]
MTVADADLLLPATDDLLRDGIERGDLLGVQLVVHASDDRSVDLALGESGPDTEMTSDTLLHWFSLTKPFIALAVLALERDGLLATDEPLSRVLPELAVEPRHRTITADDLFTHSVRFENDFESLWRIAWMDSSQVFRAALQHPHQNGDGSSGTFQYSTWVGWAFLGEAIGRLVGGDQSTFMRERVFLPLGMVDSWVGMPDAAIDGYADRLATQHFIGGPQPVPLPAMHERPVIRQFLPSFGGRGPMREIATFLRTVMDQRLPGSLAGLEPAMIEPRATGIESSHFVPWLTDPVDWGAGVQIGRGLFGSDCSPSSFGHNGQETLVAFADPVHDVVVAAGFNGMSGSVAAFERQEQLVAAIYRDLGLSTEPRPLRYDPEQLEAARTRGASRSGSAPQRNAGSEAAAAASHGVITSTFEAWRSGGVAPGLPGRVRHVVHADATQFVFDVSSDGRELTLTLEPDPDEPVDFRVECGWDTWRAQAAGALSYLRALRAGALLLSGPSPGDFVADPSCPAFYTRWIAPIPVPPDGGTEIVPS